MRRDGVLACLCDVTLSHNPLGDEGVAQLAEALGPALERIRLQRWVRGTTSSEPASNRW